MTDEIIEEVWRAKDQLARRFGYNIEALAEALQKRQESAHRPVVDLASQRRRDRQRPPA